VDEIADDRLVQSGQIWLRATYAVHANDKTDLLTSEVLLSGKNLTGFEVDVESIFRKPVYFTLSAAKGNYMAS